MNKLLISLVLVSFMSNIAFADCDFKTGITPGPNKTFIYTEECHLKVGKLVQDNKIKDQQIKDFTQALTLKDLAISKADQRAQVWQDTSGKMEERVQKADELQSKNNFLYFGIGVMSAILAGVMAAKVINATK